MYGRKSSRWMKHLDFILFDIISICLSLFLGYGLRHGFGSRYAYSDYINIGLIMIAIDIVTVFFRNSYKDVIRRGYLKELTESFTHFSTIMIGILLYLFAIQKSEVFSRLTLLWTWSLGVALMYLFRICLKTWLRKRILKKENQLSVLVVCPAETADETVKGLLDRKFSNYDITGVILTDEKKEREEVRGVSVVANKCEFTDYIKEHVVDEVFVNISKDFESVEEILDACIKMGITVHQNLMGITKGPGNKIVDEFAGYTVLTSSIKVASYSELFVKRCMDIAGSLIGLFLTVLMFPFVAVSIKVKSPGSVLFSQERIGKNGRRFRIYKFRSMYIDAENRKQELMSQNEMQGFMFKMREDPRIIPGIGEFIRKTSIDEFPQFWNVLKGDMSLVGTRPPTIEEYEQYDMHHLVRMSIKPGITGLWQVSGRNRITDFEEVVRLDTKYIEEWNINMDIKILVKTIAVLFRGNGE